MLDIHMYISVNGETIKADEGATLGDVIEGQTYHPGSKIAVIRSSDLVKRETTDYELITSRGSMVLRLNETRYAKIVKDIFQELAGLSIRWRTSKLLAVGAFVTDIEATRGYHRFKRYDCFFSLGGFDNNTTYLMLCKTDHLGQYGVDGGVVGRITRGRHLMGKLEEGDQILEIRPIVLEMKERDAFVTDDLSIGLEDGMSIETFVSVSLSRDSPVSSEHFLVLSGGGYIPITETTATYCACSRNMDVSLIAEKVIVRDENIVTVRHDGAGEGRVYFYKERRQLNPSHSLVGRVEMGRELIRLMPSASKVTVITDPLRIMTVGMTQKEGGSFLEELGYAQERTGLSDDEAVIVEQEPELTMDILDEKVVETFGVASHAINEWEFYDDVSPRAAHYLRKMTGLNHKPIGTLKVHFTYPGMPLITFEGNTKEGLDLVPENSFGDSCYKGDIGVTNQSRPQKGLIGVRLDVSDEFGPTGEERYGTNIVGRVVSPLERMMEAIQDGDIIYVRQVGGEDE